MLRGRKENWFFNAIDVTQSFPIAIVDFAVGGDQKSRTAAQRVRIVRLLMAGPIEAAMLAWPMSRATKREWVGTHETESSAFRRRSPHLALGFRSASGVVGAAACERGARGERFDAWRLLVRRGRRHPYQHNSSRIIGNELAPPVTEKPDERVADYTYWLTIFTFGLFAVAAIQGYILIRAERVATRNADAANEAAAAAKRAAEATSEIDRAFVYLKTVEITVARGPSTMGA